MANIESGTIYQLSPLVRRVTAPNGSIMTGPGTNTYLLGREQVVVIDPGPNLEQHIENIMTAITAEGGKLHSIWVTHTHRDHSPGAAELARLTGAPCYGAVIEDDGFQDLTFVPTIDLSDNFLLSTSELCLRAVYTPGHVNNHYCFLLEDEGMLFVGDHLMEGTTVVIIPPHGVMKDYIESLQKMSLLTLTSLAPGHGDLLLEPQKVIADTIRHRLARERLLLLKMTGDWEERIDLVSKVYIGLDQRLIPFAERSLHAHLIKLQHDGRVENDGERRWRKIH